MAIKWSIQGLLIYATMAAYVLAFIAMVVRRRRLGWTLYAVGFGIALASVIYRGIYVAHVPLQNLFEVFLFIAMLMFPLSLFSRRVLHVGGVAVDTIIGVVPLFAAGFVERFSETARHLPPSLQSPLFVPHVAVYMAAFVITAKAAAAGVTLLIRNRRKTDPLNASPPTGDEGIHALVCMGFPLMTGGLILGSIWGKQAWGDWWNWDPKEMWALATWGLYVGYLHFHATWRRRTLVQSQPSDDRKTRSVPSFPRIEAIFVIVGFLFVVIMMLWANLSRLFTGLHNYTK